MFFLSIGKFDIKLVKEMGDDLLHNNRYLIRIYDYHAKIHNNFEISNNFIKIEINKFI